jgi:hypothetical protein
MGLILKNFTFHIFKFRCNQFRPQEVHRQGVPSNAIGDNNGAMRNAGPGQKHRRIAEMEFPNTPYNILPEGLLPPFIRASLSSK